MQNFPATPSEMIHSLWRHRGLIQASAKREVLGRYRGSALGLFWSFFNPLLMLLVYTFVFSDVFKSRWSGGSESKTEFALVLFVGLIVFSLFSECISRAPTLILTNVNYVKKVIFPLEILPFVGLISSLYHATVSLVVWLIAYILFFGLPQPTLLLLPLIVVPLCFLIMGFSWALASLGVYLRDVSQFIGVLTTVLMFLSPIFYPISAIPERYQYLIYLNPITPVIEICRDILYWGKIPDFEFLAFYWIITMLIAWVGYAWFQKTRKGFADVL
jgi:lipopolysaccharide transport system permease protein